MSDELKLYTDSGEGFLDVLEQLAREDAEAYAKNLPPEGAKRLLEIAAEDAAGLKVAYESYGPSWKQRGGPGAYLSMVRKVDRLENRVKKLSYDVFKAIVEDTRGEGVIDDVRDIRRYLMLIEAEMRARGFKRCHRDNPDQEVKQ